MNIAAWRVSIVQALIIVQRDQSQDNMLKGHAIGENPSRYWAIGGELGKLEPTIFVRLQLEQMFWIVEVKFLRIIRGVICVDFYLCIRDRLTIDVD